MMKPEHWRRAKEIVPAARDLPPAQRSAFLDESCGDDHDLRSEVESFLAADPHAVSFIERPPIRLLDDDDALIRENSQLGAYRIEQQLGRGGMGVVYLAARADEEFRRQVAIKVLQPGLTSDDSDRRFRQEIQILANLNHPNIARLYEGGRTEDGRLYYLMEYVEGQPVDIYCRERGLSLERRLRLFQKVCTAVQYAHRNLVVHRDLKPGNVLVTDEGEPKLLDFGVAKLLEGSGIPSQALTGGGQRLFTTDYASPEQLTGGTITTASDIYSLGVLLYELLAGDRPYHLESQPEDEVRRVVCEQTPVAPSTAFPRSTEPTTTEGLSVPDSAPTSYRRRLQGDLDNIVLMALRKEPERRYSSVEQLSDDILRHLGGHPILARRPTLRYRAAKFFRRNRVWAGIAALFLLTIAASTLAQYRQHRQTVRERDRAERVTDFLVNLFAAASPEKSLGENLTVSDLMEQAARQLEWELTDEPLDRAKLLDTLGRVYTELDKHHAAEPLLRESLRIRQQTQGVEHRDTAASHQKLGHLLMRAGRYDDSEEQLRRALQIHERKSASDVLIAENFLQLATLLELKGEYKEALDRGQRALGIYRLTEGEESDEFATALTTVATTHQATGDYAAAEPFFRRALGIRRNLFGERHPQTVSAHTNLGLILYHMSRYDEAQEHLEHTLQIAEDIFGPDHLDTFSVLNNLALVYTEQRNFLAAERAFQEILTRQSESRGKEHPYYAHTLQNLARLYNENERWEDAVPLLIEAIAIKKRTLGPQHPSVATSINSLAAALEDLDRFQEAEPLYKEALAIYGAAFGRQHPNYAAVLHNTSHAYRRQGRYEDARKLAEEALQILTTTLGREHLTYARVLLNLGITAFHEGDLAKAENLYRESLEIRQKSFGGDHKNLLPVLERLEELLRAQGRDNEAQEITKRNDRISRQE